jgi:predicted alpha/beta-hydrolase family hydrolase
MVRGWLHEPHEPHEPSGAGPRPANHTAEPSAAGPRPADRTAPSASGDGLAITHGAGSNCEAPLITAVAEAFAQAGLWVLRFDLPYRQQRPHGPPSPSYAARDREGIQRAVHALRQFATARVFLGGSSYGGRQATLLMAEKTSAENPKLADGMLLLSYPLHPPGKPQQLRTDHFPKIETPAMFVHGTRDSFGSIEEMAAALKLIPSRHELVTVEGAPHGLPPKVAAWLPARFGDFMGR